MKVLNIAMTAVIALILIVACDDHSFTALPDEADSATTIKPRGEHAIPFQATFYTKRNYEDDGAGVCTEEPYTAFNYQVGEGTATHLGACDVTIHFCGSGFDYTNGFGVFVAADGDELWFNVPSEGEIGHIIPFDDPFYELYFQDPFEFVGGTGRFEGASGSGMTNSFVNLFDDDGNFIAEHQTDHVWTGTLILP